MSEIVALRSILGKDFRLTGSQFIEEPDSDGDFTELLELEVPQTKRSVYCQATICVEIPEEGIEISVSMSSSSNQPQSFNPMKIHHLPPLCLDMELVPDYPSHIRPKFHLSCFWLSESQLNLAERELEQQWSDQFGTQICFTWIDWLHTGLLESLGVFSPEPKLILDQLPIDSNIFANLVEYNNHKTKLCFKKEIWTCPICMTEDSGVNFVYFSDCGDYFCNDCFSQYCSHKIKDGQVDFCCPGYNCKTCIPAGVLKEHISQTDFTRWEDLLLNRTLETMQDIKYCPKCSTACIEETGKFSQCTKCFFCFCTDCYRPWHPGTKCISVEETLEQMGASMSEYEESKTEKARFILDLQNQLKSLAMVRKESRPCPQCGMAIEKDGGCNHMVCIYCKAHYCHACGKTIYNGYDHFGSDACVLFDDDAIAEWEEEVNGPRNREDRNRINPRLLNLNGAGRPVQCPVCKALNYKFDMNNHIRCYSCSTNLCFLCGEILPKKNATAHFHQGQCVQHTNL
eukprot:g4020.t1